MIQRNLGFTLDDPIYEGVKILLKDPNRKVVPSHLVKGDRACTITISFNPTIPGKYVVEFWKGGVQVREPIPLDTVVHVADTKMDKITYTHKDTQSLATPIQPAAANHSYNGIMFDIKAKKPQDIEILGFTVGGTLGPTTVFCRPGPWADDDSDASWSKVLSTNIDGSWQTTTFIPLVVPVTVLAGERRGFYIHCSVYHDNALFYQTYNSFGQVVAQDKHIAIFPGQARCGSSSFGRGRWRKVRGLSGAVTYRPLKKIWTPKTHYDFPPSFQRIVMLMLMMWNRPDTVFNQIPQEALYEILQCMEWDWFEEDQLALEQSEPTDLTTEFPEYDWGW